MCSLITGTHGGSNFHRRPINTFQVAGCVVKWLEAIPVHVGTWRIIKLCDRLLPLRMPDVGVVYCAARTALSQGIKAAL